MPSNGTSRNLLLDKLNQEASIATSTANDYSIRAWLTSAKKCLDQAEEDVREDDPEAAYVNYVKAISIVVEVIPRHKGMKELDERQTSQAQDYWAFRKRISSAFGEVQRLQEKLRAREYDSTSLGPQAADSTNSSKQSNRNAKNGFHATLPNDVSSLGAVSPPASHNSSFKVPRKRLNDTGFGTQNEQSLSISSTPPTDATSSRRLLSKQPISRPQSPNPKNDRETPVRQNASFPKSNLIEPSLLLSYLNKPLALRPSILLLDVRPRESYDKGCLNAKQVVWIDPITLDEEKSGKALEESLVLSPREQQMWFATRHQFDLVIIYDEDSRINSYAGGPVFDRHQVRLRNLTVAIFDFAGYMKPLKHVPMLLIGGIRSWCNLVRENPLRPVNWEVSDGVKSSDLGNTESKVTVASPPTRLELVVGAAELDLDAESRWLDSLHLESAQHPTRDIEVDASERMKMDRLTLLSSSPSTDPYNKSLLDFFQKFPGVEPESMSGRPGSRAHLDSINTSRYTDYADQTIYPTEISHRRQSTFIDHPFHGFTEVKDPEFQPPTPTKKTADLPFQSSSTLLQPNRPGRDEMNKLPERTRIPSIGSQISQMGPVSAGMTGLKNLGNTCYMNSVLQCMSATTPLARYFLSGSYRRSINVHNPLGSKGALVNAFADLIKHLWGDQYTHISPVSLRTVIGKLHPRFKNSDQQDAQDFLTFFLDGLHEDLNENALKTKLRELTPEEERRREKLPLINISKIEWERYKHNHKSFLVELFQGQFVSSLKCSVCGQTSTTCNAFMNLSVEISLPHGPQGLKLTQCIEAFVKEEVLDGENAWNCPTCKRPQKATKQLRLARLPPILIVHLKRFHYAGPWRDKLNTFIDYPMRDLDLTRFVLEDMTESQIPPVERSQKYLYDLYAVTNHFGTLSGGHYTASIHNKLRDKWYVFDDSRVSPCEDSSVVGRAGYILWYKRNNQF